MRILLICEVDSYKQFLIQFVEEAFGSIVSHVALCAIDLSNCNVFENHSTQLHVDVQGQNDLFISRQRQSRLQVHQLFTADQSGTIISIIKNENIDLVILPLKESNEIKKIYYQDIARAIKDCTHAHVIGLFL